MNVLLVGAKDASKILSISERHFRGMDSSGKIPSPVKLGERALWNVKELQGWIDVGCPSREKWQQFRGENKI